MATEVGIFAAFRSTSSFPVGLRPRSLVSEWNPKLPIARLMVRPQSILEGANLAEIQVAPSFDIQQASRIRC